jgi:hypothetical protein
MSMRTMALTLVLIGGVAAVIASESLVSPESTRTRGGRGADVGNRPAVVKIHDGADPFWNTPERIATNHPPLESARQAERLSRQ